MKKTPNIYIVIESCSDGYHTFSVDYLAWFFDEQEAYEFIEDAEKIKAPGVSYSIEEVEGG